MANGLRDCVLLWMKFHFINTKMWMFFSFYGISKHRKKFYDFVWMWFLFRFVRLDFHRIQIKKSFEKCRFFEKKANDDIYFQAINTTSYKSTKFCFCLSFAASRFYFTFCVIISHLNHLFDQEWNICAKISVVVYAFVDNQFNSTNEIYKCQRLRKYQMYVNVRQKSGLIVIKLIRFPSVRLHIHFCQFKIYQMIWYYCGNKIMEENSFEFVRI